MLNFLGNYEATLDAKLRFLLPMGIKKQLPEDVGNHFIINRGTEGCLTLYTKQVWEPIFQRFSKLGDFDLKAKAFKRIFISAATMVEMDGAGRLLIPKNLVEYAGLKKDIILASDYDKVEIWDAETYKQRFTYVSPEDFSRMAEEVMGKLPNE
jgi:MraZ protein